MKRSNLRIAVQKTGRLREGSLKFLKKHGICAPRGGKKAFIVPCADNVELLFVRYGDIPEYVASSAADFGIVGQNLLYEESKKIDVQIKLGFGRCKLVIAVPQKSQIRSIEDLGGERIATSYPNSLRKFLKQNRIGAAIVNIGGSVEAAPAIGLADAVCDLIQTGQTLKDNNLKVLAEVMESEAVLITPREQASERAKALAAKLRGEL